MIKCRKNVGEDFIILNMSDPQLSDGEWGLNGETTEGQRHYRGFMRTAHALIEKVKPDLITISGDISYPDCPRAYRKFGDFMESFQIPWAVVWGNHDNQWDLEDIDRVVDMYADYKYFLYEQGDPSIGRGNYVLGIEEEDRLVEALIMMDTHDVTFYCKEDETEEEVLAKDVADLMLTHHQQIDLLAARGHSESELSWINPKLTRKQLQWYREQVVALKEIGCRESVLLVHVPIYAYEEAFHAAFKKSYIPGQVSVEESYQKDCWNEGYEDSFGVVHEGSGIGCYPVDDGVFEAILEMDNTKTVLCGHSHANNFVTKYKGVCLAFSMKTGPGCYSRPYLDGGTVIRIGQEGVKELYHEYVLREESK